MKSNKKSLSKSTISVAQLEQQLQSLHIRDARGKYALRQTLQSLHTNTSQQNSKPARSWFQNMPAMATAMAALVLMVFGAGWFINSNNQQPTVVSSQTQANGSVQNAVNTQLQDAQTDSSLGNEDSSQINTANARLQSAVNIGNSIDETQF